MSDTSSRELPHVESAFQPILSLAHGLAIGYEALLRASDGGIPCLPEKAFGVARANGRYGEYERACMRHHVTRFRRFADDESVLFLNVHPDVLVDPGHREGIVADIVASGVGPSRVVLEILEARQETTAVLADSVALLRECGFLIALDDFGAGLTNLGRVWDLRPDVVKLDRELIWKAASSYRNARSLLRLVDLLHDIGTFIVVEGIETEEQALLCLDCDADFVQGYYFARPSADIEPDSTVRYPPRELGSRLARAHKLRHVADLEELVPYRRAFRRLQQSFSAGRSVDESATHFLHLEWATRVYLLDGEGVQVGKIVESGRHDAWRRPTFALLMQRNGANWSKRPYFRNALFHPGQVVVSEPYMSSSARNHCITLAIQLSRGRHTYVLCADVLFDGLTQYLR